MIDIHSPTFATLKRAIMEGGVSRTGHNRWRCVVALEKRGLLVARETGGELLDVTEQGLQYFHDHATPAQKQAVERARKAKYENGIRS